jgi:hypothetical protein
MTKGQTGERGFVVIDALMAVLLLSLAGTALIVTAIGLLQRETADLDRGVSLVMSQSLMRQYYVLGAQDLLDAPVVDEQHSYRLSQRPSLDAPSLVIVEVEVSPLAPHTGPSEVVLRFLAPNGTTAG